MVEPNEAQFYYFRHLAVGNQAESFCRVRCADRIKKSLVAGV